LEKVGIRALVVNAQHVKKVPGRKTDISDAEWLAMLARAGLLYGSFIPPESWRNWRQLGRYHHRTTALLVAEKNRLGDFRERIYQLNSVESVYPTWVTMDFAPTSSRFPASLSWSVKSLFCRPLCSM